MSLISKLSFFIFIISLSFIFADSLETVKTEDKEAMEVGGFVTVDLAGSPDNFNKAYLNMGNVELGANVIIKDNLKASITLLAQNNMSTIGVDQAMANYTSTSENLNAYFGLLTFNHGILTTHLISDPLLVNLVSLSAPGATITYAQNKNLYGIGFTILQGDTNTSSTYGLVFNWDYTIKENGLLRLSALGSNNISDADLALSIPFKKLTLDGEVFSQLVTVNNATKSGGYIAGISYKVADVLELALRADGTSTDMFKDMDLSIGGGATYNITDEIFCALEYNRLTPFTGEAVNSIAMQVGLESSLKLPGYQRKTLTRN